jgi:hypothetical protein
VWIIRSLSSYCGEIDEVGIKARGTDGENC